MGKGIRVETIGTTRPQNQVKEIKKQKNLQTKLALGTADQTRRDVKKRYRHALPVQEKRWVVEVKGLVCLTEKKPTIQIGEERINKNDPKGSFLFAFTF